MDLDAAAVLLAALIAVTLIVLYVVESRREYRAGADPFWAAEVYFAGGAFSADSRAATPAQVAVYRAAGGKGPEPGPEPGSPGSGWRFGPKPRRGTDGVLPFSPGRWFQPPG